MRLTPLLLPSGMTNIQSAVWLDQQLHPGKPIYNTGQFLSIRGNLRVDLFEAALRDAVAESPGLQLHPRPDAKPFDLTLLDFCGEKEPLIAAKQWMQSEMGTAIPVDDPRLFRFALIRISADHTLWFQKFHHIIIDATGRLLLSRRTASRYRTLCFGEPLPAVTAVSPDELLDEERRYIASQAYATDRDFWIDEFAQWPGPLHEGSRQHTERANSGRHARIAFTLKRADFDRLDQTARQLGSSTFRAIIALAFAAFARLYNRYDIVLGLELANRSDAKAKQTIGFLARPLPMILRLDAGKAVADALRHVEEMRSRNYPHRNYPIQELARDLAITRKGYHGLFDVIVNYIPAAYDFRFEDSPVELTNLSYGFAAPWALTIADTGLDRDLDVTLDTDSGLIPGDMAARLANAIQILLQRGLDNLECPIAELPMMPEETREKVLAFSSGDNFALPEEATLDTLCLARAEQNPDAIALICGQQQLSFGELHRRAELLARKLLVFGVRRGGIVGIALPRTPDLVIAVLAVHKAGAAYLALDPAYPADRIRFMVADAGCPVILTDATLAPVFKDCGAKLLLDSELAAAEAATVKPIPAIAGDLAYVLYTSGSTGRPKAVGISHRNLVNLISWGRSQTTDEELRGMLFSTSLNFDLSAFEMFLPLAFGGCLIMVENVLALQSAPQRDKIRLINTGPSLFEALLRSGGLPRGVTKIILAGEILSRRLATMIFEALPNVELINCYGPTETTVYSSFALVAPKAGFEPAIGRPIWNTTLYVLDSGRQLVAPGVEGELFIGGAGVAPGYLGRPELTAERFLPNPFGPGHVYRTGDRVRWRAGGELEFLGRADDQIKIHGIRIEPGEIESTLLALPSITAAVVMAREDAAGVLRLIAYIVPSPAARPSEEDLRVALARRLPRNMVPSFFVYLDSMPMTPNGKLDRKALPAPPREDVRSPANRLAETRLESEIAAIWQDLLGVSPIHVQSDFFDLGGDSLLLLSLFATIEARYGRRLTVDVLSGGLTVATLALALAGQETSQIEMNPVVALQPKGHLPPFFCVHGIGGDVVHLHRLAIHMGADRPFFGLRRTSEASETDSIVQIAQRYVAAMLAQQSQGPFFLGGYSFGAMVAYEMALQLVRQGHEVGLLAIIDQRRPNWKLTVRNAWPVMPQMLAALPRRLRDEMAEVAVTDRFSHIRRTISRWSRAAVGHRASANLMFDLSQSPPEQIQILESHLKALREYRPVASSLPITLFRARDQLLSHLALDSTLGWSTLAKSNVKVHVVPGSHGSMATEPLVRDLAKALSEELDLAQRGGRLIGPSQRLSAR